MLRKNHLCVELSGMLMQIWGIGAQGQQAADKPSAVAIAPPALALALAAVPLPLPALLDSQCLQRPELRAQGVRFRGLSVTEVAFSKCSYAAGGSGHVTVQVGRKCRRSLSHEIRPGPTFVAEVG